MRKEAWNELLEHLDDTIKSAIALHHDDNQTEAKTQYWQGYADSARNLRSEVVRAMKEEG